ncbi:hypothetical protein AX15_001233 [Amanita polypyramis BW_CC]|nr:hypothetical protein AX15_001233 [Amanita polypyramis BW_CC]
MSLSEHSMINNLSTQPTYAFSPPTDAASTRSPCPALNTLANHHYISHDGKAISYTVLIDALCSVYNVSRPLAHLLSIVGYATCGKVSFSSRDSHTHTEPNRVAGSTEAPDRSFSSRFLSFIPISWTLDLASLSQRGGFKIAHDASLVHVNNMPSHSPDPALVAYVVEYASNNNGLSLRNLARLHAKSLAKFGKPLDNYHEQIASGECAFLWLVMREGDENKGDDDVVPVGRVKQWLGEERLPDDWTRPSQTISLREARSKANILQKLSTSLKVA